jgi:hypothetical protein
MCVLRTVLAQALQQRYAKIHCPMHPHPHPFHSTLRANSKINLHLSQPASMKVRNVSTSQ